MVHVSGVWRRRLRRLLARRYAAVVDLILVADGAPLLWILLLVALVLLRLSLGTRWVGREFTAVLAAGAARGARARRRLVGMLGEGRWRRRRGIRPRQRRRRRVPGGRRRRRRDGGRGDLLSDGGGGGGARAVARSPAARGPRGRRRRHRRLGLVPVLLVSADPVEVRRGGGSGRGGRRSALVRVVPVSAVVVRGIGGPLLRGRVVRRLLVVVERLLLHLMAPVLVVPSSRGHAPEAAVPRVIWLEVRYVVVLSCCWVTGRLVVSSHTRHVFDKSKLALSSPTLFYHCTGTGTHLSVVTTSEVAARNSCNFF